MILFLDFDGVLHPVGSKEGSYFCQLPMLEAFLQNEAPDWKIVISSSWREYFSFQELLSFFSVDIRARIIGCTLPDGDAALLNTWGQQAMLIPREVQIRQFLFQRGLGGERWLALDDMAGWFSGGSKNPNLILCDASVGFGDHELAQLRQRK